MVLAKPEKILSLVKGKQTTAKTYIAQRQFLEHGKTNSSTELIDAIRHALEWHEMQHQLRRQHQELQALESRFHNVIDKNADSIIIVDAQGIIRFANPATEFLFNGQISQLIGQELFGKFVVEKKTYNLNTEIMPVGGGGGNSDMRVVQAQVDILGPSGEKALAEMRVVETEWEGKMAFLVLLRDVTERQQALDALRQERDFVKTLVEASPAFFIAVSPEGKILMVNPAMLNALGYSLEEALGLDYISNLLVCGQELTVAERFEHLAKLRKPFSEEVQLRTKDGRIVLVEWHSRPVFQSSGGLDFIFAVGLDITERKRVEISLRESEGRFREQTYQLQKALYELQEAQSQLVQSEKMSSLGQMVAGVAHEINNPINFIYGNLAHASQYARDLIALVQLYQKNYPNPVAEIQEKAENIDLEFVMEDMPNLISSMELGADRIRQIVLSLRNFSRLDEADAKLVNIHEGIDSTLLILHNRLKAKPGRPEIQIVKDYGNLPAIECYPGQLNQVFMNILANAIDSVEQAHREKGMSDADFKAYPKAASSVCAPVIRIRTGLKNDDRAVISITDNGTGMTEAVRRRLFDPFFTTKPVGKGTGLGLSISYQIVVERHSGNLNCVSSPGQGAEFIIEIPLRQNGVKKSQPPSAYRSYKSISDMVVYEI